MLRVGMTDPFTNETVKYLAEIDEEAVNQRGRKRFIMLSILILVFCLFLPCAWLLVALQYYLIRYQVKGTLESRVYLTDHTLVYGYAEGVVRRRVTIPLANVASVNMVQPSTVTVIIKSTAPGVVLLGRGMGATRVVPIQDIKDAEGFAHAIREQIN